MNTVIFSEKTASPLFEAHVKIKYVLTYFL